MGQKTLAQLYFPNKMFRSLQKVKQLWYFALKTYKPYKIGQVEPNKVIHILFNSKWWKNKVHQMNKFLKIIAVTFHANEA